MGKLKIESKQELSVVILKEQALTTSRNVAEIFGKRHDHVLRDIKNLGCSSEFSLLNFGESSYKNEQNKKQPMYLITKDGFAMLAFGFTGKKAAKFKEDYIKQFNLMESIIKQKTTTDWKETRNLSKDYQKLVTDAVKPFVEYAEANNSSKPNSYYISFGRLANKAVGIKDGERDIADKRKLQLLTFVLDLMASSIEQQIAAQVEYHQAYRNVQNRVNEFVAYIPSSRQIAI